MYLSNHSNKEEASMFICDLIINRINAFKPNQNKKFVLCLPTGSTPLLVYKELAERCKQGKISFEHVITINLDEYAGLEPDHEQSYYHFMEESFFSKALSELTAPFELVDIPLNQFHLLPGSPIPPLNESHEDSCSTYESLITSLGGINLSFCGIGENGHIAFNEPGSSFNFRTRLVKLDEETRKVNARFFYDKSHVPTHALTMGIGTIMAAQEIIVLAIDSKKSEAVRNALEGGINHLCPASVLQLHETVIFVTDEEASQDLKESTKKYLALQSPVKDISNYEMNNVNSIVLKRPHALRGSSFNLSLSPLSPKENYNNKDGDFTWSRPVSTTDNNKDLSNVHVENESRDKSTNKFD
ncbi:glucosamine-6-phosphate deaminase [Kwoniella dendrophila CBS 6074]|uniref:Glucosamine-6-phosphate isomerase n=1 Tax=Kwoniella dendrophila CBS 6074 TaxID=1295534 RepID=A0AAX4JLI4_9TREE